MNSTVFDLLKNNGIIQGSIVLSKAGHDFNRIYIVLSVENKMALLADGTYRNMTHPKKKRVTHLKTIGTLPDWEQRIRLLEYSKTESGQNRLIQEWLLEISTENETNRKKEEP